MDLIPALFWGTKQADWGAPSTLLGISSIHATVNGVLAGFNIAVVVLLATLNGPRRASEKQALLKQATVGVFMVAFVGYIVTAILYSAVPERTEISAFFLYAAAHSMYQFSSVLAFLGLYPLFEIVPLPRLSRIAFITLIGAVLGGFFASAIPYHDLLRIRTRWILLSFLLSCMTSVVIYFSRIWILSRKGSRDLLVGVLRVLYASVGLIILVFTMAILLFFAPGIGLWEPYIPLVALGLLFTAASFSLSVPLFVLKAIHLARR